MHYGPNRKPRLGEAGNLLTGLRDLENGPISAPRWRMSPLVGLLIAWGVLTAILIVLLIYRSTLTIHEDDSIFLNESNSHMEREQTEILAKMNKITPIVKVLGAISGAMILVIAGLFIYQGLTMATTPQ
jgi:hypothetical protein